MDSKERPFHRFLNKEAFTDLFDALRRRSYTVIAPHVQKGAVRLAEAGGPDQLPRGVRDLQDGGHYRLEKSEEDLYFEEVVGPDSAKRFLFPPHQDLFSFAVQGEAFVMDEARSRARPPSLALVGLRPCDLAAIRVQDRVFGFASEPAMTACQLDRYYCQAREQMFVVAANCTRPGGTCFCHSMGTGPEATEGFDIALTELRSGFLIRPGSEAGAELLGELEVRDPSEAELELADLKLRLARENMGRHLNTRGIVALLERTIEHPRWDEVAGRCLSCGNCTMVCPTCFCSTVIDANELGSESMRRSMHWESCFSHRFSYMTTGPHRSTIRGRYRHWLRHKLGTWWEQFGTSGCVGCGRCITWCPVGIDLTEEIAALRADRDRHEETLPYRMEGGG
jgi:ferredoxin